MTKSNTSTAFITRKHTNMNPYYKNDHSQAKVLKPLALERTLTHILQQELGDGKNEQRERDILKRKQKITEAYTNMR